MFNNKKIKKLEDKVLAMEKYLEVNKINEEVIGEVYCERNTNRPASKSSICFFKPFQKQNVSDQVDNKIKIFGKWFDKNDVIYYKDIYKPERSIIEKRYELKVKDFKYGT